MTAGIEPLSACWFLVGPTAGGKTAVGLALARALDAEIVSLDSMALYRGLDIGTAKPTPAERAAVPHHLIDVLEPDEDFSVAQYLAAAQQAVNEILARGKTPLFVGGTALYLKAALRGLCDVPAADWDLRHRLEEEARERPAGWLHARLVEVDPALAGKLHANDERRLIRALEVYELTQRPLSDWQKEFERGRPADSLRVFQLDWPREELHARIDARVDAMMAAGWVDEVENLLAAGKTIGRTARQAVGYGEILRHVERGAPLAEVVPQIKFKTHQFARRQCTWFRSLSELRRVSLSGKLDAKAVASRIAAEGREKFAGRGD